MDTPYAHTPELFSTVLNAAPAAHGQTATLHQITAQVREKFPDIRLDAVASVLLILSADGKVRIMGIGESRRYARRV